MFREITGNLLTCGSDVICHQTNYFGSMGGGVAAAIWDKILDDTDRVAYVKLCEVYGDRLLGRTQYLYHHGMPIVANVFSQNAKPISQSNLTNYVAMEVALERVKRYAQENGYTIAVPGYMGCGIAGGDWNRVHSILYNAFASSSVEMTIVYLERRDTE